MSEEKIDTKDRLLDAAESLFLEKGFEEVSIRELASAAGVNVAAVNYHFQGKDNLYREVIKRRFVSQRDRILENLNLVLEEYSGKPPLDQLIRSIVHMHLSQALSQRPEAMLMKLIVHELHSKGGPVAPLFLTEMVAPVFRSFSDALMQARPNLEQKQVDWIIASIIGQIHHFIMRWQKSRGLGDEEQAQRIMLAAFPALRLPVEEYIEETTNHITRFSTAAVDALYPEVSP